MKVYIRAEDLSKGNYCSPESCPISKALKRKFKRKFVVGPQGASYFHPEKVLPDVYGWPAHHDTKVQLACEERSKKGFHITVKKLYLGS